MQIIKGGFSFVEFDTVSSFTNPIRIQKLLKAGTGFPTKSLTEDFADGKPGVAGKVVEMGIRSADVDNTAGSAYAALKAAEEARTPLFFRFVKTLGESILVDDCEAAWGESAGNSVVSSADAVDYQAGTHSTKLTKASTIAINTIMATKAVTLNLTTVKAISLWLKSVGSKNSGDLQLLLDNTANCASPLETLNIPALAAGAWTRHTVVLSNPSALGSIISIGLKNTIELTGGETIHVDDVQGMAGYVAILNNVIVKVDFELNEAGKHNALKVAGVGFSDTEANLLSTNF
jgi:hypothetical protein